ncbi:hypothetical protein TGCAST_310798 [Toxoplasma gondii CAST]|uniref:Uncharacterized protein n=1 Tax=Toxoplasma gondii CAST TaxID=943122 RepID=A0A425I1H1_TOXGO|nr:hypothetical protein TGCAST_310798 [Toxoplasma gondii CAST]
MQLRESALRPVVKTAVDPRFSFDSIEKQRILGRIIMNARSNPARSSFVFFRFRENLRHGDITEDAMRETREFFLSAFLIQARTAEWASDCLLKCFRSFGPEIVFFCVLSLLRREEPLGGCGVNLSRKSESGILTLPLLPHHGTNMRFIPLTSLRAERRLLPAFCACTAKGSRPSLPFFRRRRVSCL